MGWYCRTCGFGTAKSDAAWRDAHRSVNPGGLLALGGVIGILARGYTSILLASRSSNVGGYRGSF